MSDKQSRAVLVTVSGTDRVEVDYWIRKLREKAEFKGDNIERNKPTNACTQSFWIYPR